MTPAEARQALGLSVWEMAQLLGVDRDTWYKWESGKQRAPAVAVRAMRNMVWLHDQEPVAYARLRKI